MNTLTEIGTRWEKSDSVLWSALPDGFVLNNFAHRHFLLLEQWEKPVWDYLDGAHTIAEIASIVNLDEEMVLSVVQKLRSGDFIVEAAP